MMLHKFQCYNMIKQHSADTCTCNTHTVNVQSETGIRVELRVNNTILHVVSFLLYFFLIIRLPILGSQFYS